MQEAIQLPEITGLLASRSLEPSPGWTFTSTFRPTPDIPVRLLHAYQRVISADGNRSALESVEREIDQSFDDSQLRVLLGIEYLRFGTIADRERATLHFRKAKSLAPASYEPAHFLSAALLAAGEVKGAYKNARVARRAALTPRERSTSEWIMAVALSQLDDWKKAVEHMERAVHDAPDDADVRSTYARMLVRVGRLVEALPILDQLHEELPRDIALHAERLAVLVDLGRVDDALVAAQSAAAAEPEGAVQAMYLGTILNEIGRFDESIAEYVRSERLFAKKPELADGRAAALQAIAIVLLRRVKAEPGSGDHDAWLRQAEEAVEQALELAPDNSSILTTAAIIAQIEGRLEEASDLYEDSLELDPDYQIARVNLGDLRRHIATLDDDEREQLLVDAGLLCRPVEPLDESYWDMPAPSIPSDLLVRAIEDDRDGR